MTENTGASQLSSWVHATTEIPAGGLERSRQANGEERRAIATALNLLSLDSLQARYRIVSIAGGGWRLSGSIEAQLAQPCVVTLEPVPATLSETFQVEFWRDLEEPEGGEDKSILEGADVEPLAGDDIPAGRIVFETLSGALDPYPRKAGAEFGWQDKNAENPQKTSPFSVLQQLKNKR